MSRASTQVATNLMTAPGGTAFLFENAAAMSFAGWIFLRSKSNGTANNVLFNLPSTNTGTNGFSLNINGGGGRTGLRTVGKPNTTDAQATLTHSVDIALNTWTHVAGACNWATDTLYVATNGVVQSSTTTNWVTTTFYDAPNSGETFRIGTSAVAAPASTDFVNADLSHFAFWNVLFANTEFTALAGGASPYEVQPTNLVLYYPFWGLHSPEIELINNRQLTITGTIAAGASEPPIDEPLTLVGSSLDTMAISGASSAAIASRVMQMRKAA